MNTISKDLLCISMRNGVEVWIESERASAFVAQLEKLQGTKFVRIDGQVINTADVVGIFSASTMGDVSRRKNGQHRCHSGRWHDKDEKCFCSTIEEKEKIKEREYRIKNCKLGCVSGFIQTPTGMAMCGCLE